MGVEEQVEERQVLDSIFPDEITDISNQSYRISITLDIPDGEEDQSQPSMLLAVTYPETYPDTAPHLELSSPQNASNTPHLDVPTDGERLLADIQPTIDENIGMAMVFTIVSALKEAAESLIRERQAAAQALRDVEAAKAEEEENRRFHGTSVTRESFLEWRARFKKELQEEEERRREEKEAEDKKKRVKTDERLTGKQLWERGLAGRAEDEGEDDGDDALQHLSNLRVEA